MAACPKQIGRYTIEAVLGTGGFGIVYLGHDLDLDRRVAIKVLADNWSLDDEIRKRFTNEARTMAQFSAGRARPGARNRRP